MHPLCGLGRRGKVWVPGHMQSGPCRGSSPHALPADLQPWPAAVHMQAGQCPGSSPGAMPAGLPSWPTAEGAPGAQALCISVFGIFLKCSASCALYRCSQTAMRLGDALATCISCCRKRSLSRNLAMMSHICVWHHDEGWEKTDLWASHVHHGKGGDL